VSLFLHAKFSLIGKTTLHRITHTLNVCPNSNYLAVYCLAVVTPYIDQTEIRPGHHWYVLLPSPFLVFSLLASPFFYFSFVPLISLFYFQLSSFPFTFPSFLFAPFFCLRFFFYFYPFHLSPSFQLYAFFTFTFFCSLLNFPYIFVLPFLPSAFLLCSPFLFPPHFLSFMGWDRNRHAVGFVVAADA